MQILKTLNKLFLAALIFLLPITVLTFFTDFFELPKTILLVTISTLALLNFAITTAVSGKIKLRVSKIDLPLLLLTISIVLSGIVKSQNKMEVFFIPGVATAFLAILISYHSIKNAFFANKRIIATLLTSSATVMSIISIFGYFGLLAKIPQLPPFIKAITFSTIGGKLPEVIFLSTILPLAIYLIFSEKEIVKKLLFSFASLIIAISLFIAITFILPGKPTAPILVNFPISWSVAVDTLKMSPVFGIGTGNYLNAFNKFLPVTYNQQLLWGARFTTSRSYVLTLATETGLIGLAAFAITLIIVLQQIIKSILNLKKEFSFKEASAISLLILTIYMFVFPASLVLIFLFVVLSVLLFEDDEMSLNLSAKTVKNSDVAFSRMPAVLLSFVILAGIITLTFFATKALGAERKYKIALDALSKSDARVTYDNLTRAIALNSYVDRYHATFAQVNMALARSLAQKKDLTDADKSTVATLIQQAIKEAKATAALNPGRSANWELLAATYRAVMPFATGADQFAIQSYTQAITLDPVNPNLRIALGGVYYALGKYDNAIDNFKLAVLAKNNLANAHYNLAIAYREKKDYDNAIAEMNKVLGLVTKGSNDETLAKNTLSDIQKNKLTKNDGSTETLNTPQTVVPTIKPPITLPSDSNPPTQQ